MVHPRELIRVNSDAAEFTAPVDNYNPIDCGISAIPCLNRVFNLEKYAKPAIFVTVLSLVGFIQGALLYYFRGTSQLWSEHFDLNKEIVEWFIYTNEVFVGFFGLVVAYWGNRIHRATWIGSLAIYHAIACLLLIIVEIYEPIIETGMNNRTLDEQLLCHQMKTSKYMENKEFNYCAIVILVIFQMFFASASISFVTHGITYIDDNISPKHSPGYIGVAIAAREIGKQAGLYLSWAPFILEMESIFISPVWLIMSTLGFLLGGIVCLFPRELPNMAIERVAASILDLAQGVTSIDEEERKKKTIDGFFKSLWRILKNRFLIINILSILVLQSALINFSIFEPFFNQSRFQIPINDYSRYNDPAVIQLSTNLLKQPLIAVFTIACGMIIAKVRPRVKKLVLWNIVVFILVMMFFGSTGFWSCAREIENDHKKSLTQAYCSKCICSLDRPFHPICLNDKTYFNPCFAGCRNKKELNGYTIYSNCTCGSDDATDGSCDWTNCNTILGLSQVNNIISSGLLATTVVTNIIVNMRCILAKDKALALGLELTFVGLIPYIPVKIAYGAIADKFCQYYGNDSCKVYSESFATFLSSSTVVLIGVATLLAVLLYFLINDIELYKIKKENSGTELNEMSDAEEDLDVTDHVNLRNRSSYIGYQIATPTRPRRSRQRNRHSESDAKHLDESNNLLPDLNGLTKNYSSEGKLITPLKTIRNTDKIDSFDSQMTTDSLRDLENVGDDHDSDIDSLAAEKIRTPNSLKKLAPINERNSIHETDF